MNLEDLRVWIIGGAKSGIAAAQILSQAGADVFVSDAGPIAPDYKKLLISMGVNFEEGKHSIDAMLESAQLVVLSPSIPLDKPLPRSAYEAGIPVVSEIEVASWFLPEKAFIVGITGTNGKSTTTHYAAQLFALGQKNSVACGNYGLPFCEALLNPARYNSFIVELSSYQLETTYSLRPHVSLFLNLQNDHQARYGNMAEYLKAKWRLILMTRPDGLAVVDEQVIRLALAQGLPLPECHLSVFSVLDGQPELTHLTHPLKENLLRILPTHTKSISLPVPTYGSLQTEPLEELLTDKEFSRSWIETTQNQGTQKFSFCTATTVAPNTSIKIAINEPCLPGIHNQANIAMASLAGLHGGLHAEVIEAQWNASTTVYQHLAHRLEDINNGKAMRTADGRIKSILAINDSKATNVESTIVAVKSFPRSIRLLLGGEPKGDCYGDLIPYIGKNVCKVYPFGKAAPLIREQLASVAAQVSEPSARMTDAADLALNESIDGDVVLLSPACASFDEFKNFEHRGDAFRHWVFQHVLP